MNRLSLILVLCLSLIGTIYSDTPLSLKTWTIDGEVEVFGPDNLWEIINGAADSYISYGFAELRAFEVVNGELRFMVHVYDMVKPLAAFGIYRSENPPQDESVRIGAETQFSDYLAVMLNGRYYVKIESIKGKANEANCRSLIEELHLQLDGNNRFPEELHLLPKEHLVPQSEQYILEHFLGVSELGNALLGRYQEGELNYRLFVMPNQDIDLFFQSLPPEWKRERRGGLRGVRRDIPYIGPVVISVHKGTLMGIVDVKDEQSLERILERVLGE